MPDPKAGRAGSLTPTRAHTSTHVTFCRRHVQLDTLGLPAGTPHVEGGIAEPQVAVSTRGTQELAQGAGDRQSCCVKQGDDQLGGRSGPLRALCALMGSTTGD